MLDLGGLRRSPRSAATSRHQHAHDAQPRHTQHVRPKAVRPMTTRHTTTPSFCLTGFCTRPSDDHRRLACANVITLRVAEDNNDNAVIKRPCSGTDAAFLLFRRAFYGGCYSR